MWGLIVIIIVTIIKLNLDNIINYFITSPMIGGGIHKLKDNMFYLNQAKTLYKSTPNIYINSPNNLQIENGIISVDKLANERILNNIPESTSTATEKYDLDHIKYKPFDNLSFNTDMDDMFKYAIISTDPKQNLNENEIKNMKRIIKNFKEGKTVEAEKTVVFKDKTFKKIYGCDLKINKKRKYSNVLKPRHWGQRKLLMSEIDFMNRVALDLNSDFSKVQFNVVYPGSGSSTKTHLLFLLDLYPNITFYLWDPAIYNNVLFAVEIETRNELSDKKLKLPDNVDMKLVTKYKGRIRVNMNLSNDDFLRYMENSKTDASLNYPEELGFFNKHASDYYRKYISEKNSDKKKNVKTLLISDIRLFTEMEALNFMVYGVRIKKYNAALNIGIENNHHVNYERDMELQKSWVNMLNPDFGLLKFKLKSKKFGQNKPIKYIEGKMVLQPWAPSQTSESRLYFTKDCKEIIYDPISYTNKFNTVNERVRPKRIDTEINGFSLQDLWKDFLPHHAIGMDCILETKILIDYLKIINKLTFDNIKLFISDITQICFNNYDTRDTCLYGKVNKNQIRQILKNRKKKYHSRFFKRLDYRSSRRDYVVCFMKENNNKW